MKGAGGRWSEVRPGGESRSPKPSAGRSSVGWPRPRPRQSCQRGAPGSVQFCGPTPDQSWEQETRKQSQHGCGIGPGQFHGQQCWGGLTPLLPASPLCCSPPFGRCLSVSFLWVFMKRKVTKPYFIPDLILHHLGSREMSFLENLRSENS